MLTKITQELEIYKERFGHLGLLRENEKRFSEESPKLEGSNYPDVKIDELPVSAGVAKWMQTEYQGSQGSCQGHAITSATELLIYRKTGEKLQLNRQFAYITTQMIDGLRGDVGSSIAGGVRAGVRYGHCLEDLWPYTGIYDTRIPRRCFEDAEKRKITHGIILKSYNDCLKFLVYGFGGISIGIDWSQSCYPDSDGKIDSYQEGDGRSGHALAILDWNARFTNRQGLPYLGMLNSHGREYGINGWAYLSPKVVDHFCKNHIVVGVADMDGEELKIQPIRWDI